MMITKTGTEYAGITDNVLDYSLSTKRFEKRIMKFTANLSLAGILFGQLFLAFLELQESKLLQQVAVQGILKL